MSDASRRRWLDSLSWQIEFYSRGSFRRRQDPEFEWQPYEKAPARRFPMLGRVAKQVLKRLDPGRAPLLDIDWLKEHGDPLWSARALLADDLSRLLFDAALTVRLTDHRQFYFPRIDFDDLIEITDEVPFDRPEFPHDYLGVPLRTFAVRIPERLAAGTLRIVTRRIQLLLVNSYRQYLVRRQGIDISPRPGEVVYDCGACIGEISILFSGLVAPAGEVHLFDPMSLHTRFCRLQTDLNPALDAVCHINTCAVGKLSRDATAPQVESSKIEPGAISGDSFSCVTLDDYAGKQTRCVDFIKMDIEGAEIDALTGAQRVIADQKPRLAISAYHKPEHFWEIPLLLRALNPTYTLYFGHHTPISWESVFYAVDAGSSGRLREK